MSEEKNLNEKNQRSVGAGVVSGGVVSARRRGPTIVPLPLKGKRVLVTRTREQASVLSERLRTLGATPIEFPTIRIVPPHDWEPLDNALRKLYTADSADLAESNIYSRGDPLRSPWPTPLPFSPSPSTSYYHWLIFTSANGVNIVIERLRNLGYEPSAIGPVRVAAIGP